jgi:CDP-diacylglycerol--serine O-phosphatidyltransferase
VLLPNLATTASLVLALVAIQFAIRGRPVAAAWFCLLCTLTDKLDGLLARTFRGTSEFGVQFDSLADLCSFGVAPAVIFYAYFAAHPELGWAGGAGLVALQVVSALWVVCAALRLARYNVAAAQGPSAHFTGTPTTMTAGIVVSLFLMVLTYSAPALSAPETFSSWRLLGALRLDALVPLLPLALVAGGVSMISPVRIPKLGRTRSRVLDVVLITMVVFGYTMGIVRRLPEYLVGGGIYWYGLGVAYHLRTRRRAEADPTPATRAA